MMMLMTPIAGPEDCVREVGLRSSAYSQYLSLLTSAIDLLLQSTCYMHKTIFEIYFLGLEVWHLG